MIRINITNGELLNVSMESESEEVFIPFNEAMIEGSPIYPLFESEFIAERCNTYGVTIDKYLEIGKKFWDFCANLEQYDELILWFGQDMFCQINLLSLLAYLEQKLFKGEIYTVILDDYTKCIMQDKTRIRLGIFVDAYKKLFYSGKYINCNNHYINKAVKEYLDLQNNNNTIIKYITNNSENMNWETMFKHVWNMTRNYGFGDTQVIKMIEKNSKLRRKNIN